MEGKIMSETTQWGRKLVTVASSVALALGGTLAAGTSAHAATASPVYMNFESNDSLGAAAAAFSNLAGTAAVAAAPAGNDSGQAFKFTKNGDAWSGVNLLLPGSTAYAYTNSDHPSITLDYYSGSSVPSPVTLKLEKVGLWASTMVQEAAPGWNHLTFNFDNNANWHYAFTDGPHPEFNILAIFPNYVDKEGTDVSYTGASAIAAGDDYYIDNISINGGTAADVVSAGSGGATPGTLRLTSPVIDTTTNGFDGQEAMDHWINDADKHWYPAGSTYKYQYVDAGSDLNLTYQLKDTNGNPMANTEVDLSVNKSYSGSAAALTCGATVVNAAASPGDGALLVGTTNESGNVTFSCTNTNTDAEAAARPTSFTAKPADGSNPFSQIWASTPAGPTGGDITEFHFVKSASAPVPDPRTAPAITMTMESNDSVSAGLAQAADANHWQGWFASNGSAGTEMAAAPAGGNGTTALKFAKGITGAGDAWSGLNFLNTTSGTTKLTDATHHNITMNFYNSQSVAVPVTVKLGGNVEVVQQAAAGWSKLTFDMSTDSDWSSSTEYTTLVVYVDWNDTNATTVNTDAAHDYYIDNVGINGGTTPAIPAVVTAVKPANTKAASLSGTAKVGKTLTAAKGTWSGTTPVTYSYKWYRCTKAATATPKAAPVAADKCTLIAGTTSSRKLVAADKGKYLRVLVTGTNSAGNAKSLSKTTAKVG